MKKGKHIIAPVMIPASRKKELVNLLDATGHPKQQGLVTKVPGVETRYQIDLDKVESEIRPTVIFLIDCGANQKGQKKEQGKQKKIGTS